MFSFSFRRNVDYDPSEIFSMNRVLRFVFVFVTVRGGVSTKLKTSTRFVLVGLKEELSDLTFFSSDTTSTDHCVRTYFR